MTPRQVIDHLIAFDTTSRYSNMELIHWVADYLKGWGIESSLSRGEDDKKANLFATLGPVGDGGIVLSGHTDVVPVDGQPWDTDPFKVVEKDGKLYGRGTSDMKSFIAIALALVPEFLERGLRKPLHLALTFDEEIGCLGVQHLIDDVKAQGIRPEAAIIGEPTNMEVVDAHKGIAGFRTSFRGVPAHSSMTHIGVSATHAAGRFVAFLDDLFEEYQGRARPDLGFVPPYTTIQVGIMNGGIASNIIAQDCLVDWHFRTMPTDDPAEIEARAKAYLEELKVKLHAQHPECDVTTTLRASVLPLKPDAASPATELALALTGANDTNQASFATEAGIFQNNGLPAVVCGPGDIAQAHQPNEFITLEQVDACTAFLRRLMGRICER
ncbi:MAG: acetylornithine deacetylase [Rhodospirillaceae bacterium]|nr:acetylornithine deacetylase [Rhodospirillaceae bacterium]MBT6202226.1 acetylornithine deacetylase [Rhodospirillaceae bacterium]MBT6509570.1 acetylornithine deacetylase [Rhodospirillaceae bacterium]MBT7615310.1 acetylornithine deacetylase [Rhodospirillaceae bacterium]MBT7647539.1 acetylornithine deacetylase [Rhodospirillaceae bacterium]